MDGRWFSFACGLALVWSCADTHPGQNRASNATAGRGSPTVDAVPPAAQGGAAVAEPEFDEECIKIDVRSDGSSCTVRLAKPRNPRVGCQGSALLDGQDLECGTADGWTLRDGLTLELTGRACEQFKVPGAHLEVYFPCPAIPEN